VSNLGPISFQGMRPQPAAGASQSNAAPAPAAVDGLQLHAGNAVANQGLIESVLHRPYAHHQAENLWCAMMDMVGPQWGGNTVPPHIAKNLRAIQEYHG
jgi:hypothetical protein